MAVFFEEPGEVFWFRVLCLNCCWYACGCRSSHTHIHIDKACASVICDSPIKWMLRATISLWNLPKVVVKASSFYTICVNPTKVDATGHHRNVIYCRSKALSFQSLAPATYKSCACHGFFLRPQFRGVICMGLPMPRTCNAHAAHMQHTCNTHATHMQHEHFPCKCPSKVAAGQKSSFSILRPELGLQTSNPARWL